ncbi:cell wall-binding repeat-containing protein [Peptostreptococcus porci]|uniref:cell wall-binding repeat-containing protein n=1 Tax=Peptostreptococcus porci TaxID=2652282 RepID=UPI002A8194BD|nr:cell wall-binding repeat-containing protein [Peptostreptococcus porci]MDY4128016.1 cell wall-binding repeat-containing protein [Peptostreptococcus porci]
MKKLDKMILLSLSLTLLLQSNALAGEKKIERIYGKDRYETSARVADSLSNSFEKVIVASGEMFPDALAGSVLTSGKYPIVLASKDRLDPSVRAKISKTKEVYILGGSETISSAVENDIKSLGAKVSRLSGMDRYETSVKIAQVTGSKDLILVNGDLFPDSLTASGIALLNNRSILLVKSNEMPQSVKDYIKKINPSSITIIGGSKSVDDRLEKESKLFTNNVKRISGRDRYETSLEVAKQFTNLKNLVVASGDNFSDALSASSIAGKLKAPILLVDGKKGTATVDYIEKNKKNIDSIKVVGGPNMVSDSTFKSISNVVETKDVKKEEDKKLIGTIVKPNKDKPSSVKPNTDKPNPDKPNTDKPNPDKPNQENPKLADKPADGVWYGTAFEGFGTRQNGATVVKVKIADGKIESVQYVKHGGEGEEYIKKSQKILEKLKGKSASDLDSIVKELSNGDFHNKGEYADVVTGATKTARGYVIAAEKAIERARKYKDDKKDQKIAYIKIAGENEFDPSKDRVKISSQSEVNLEKNKPADFDFVLYDIGMSDGSVVKNVKFSELGKYGITSNFKQGQDLNLGDNTNFFDLEVKDESGYAMETINLSVSKGPEKKKVRPDYILVTFKDGKNPEKINIVEGEHVYDKTFDRAIEKVELYKDGKKLSDSEYRKLQSYYILEKFNDSYKLGKDEAWESTVYRLVARMKNNPGGENPGEEKPGEEKPQGEIKDLVPAKIVIKDKKSDKELATIDIKENEWSDYKTVKKTDIMISDKYGKQATWKVDDFKIVAYNKEKQELKVTAKKDYGLLTVKVKSDEEESHVATIGLKFVEIKDEEDSKVDDLVPAKIVIKDKNSDEELTSFKIEENEWSEYKTAKKFNIEISDKYGKQATWKVEDFKIEAFNKKEQKLEIIAKKESGVLTVRVKSDEEESHVVTIGLKFVDKKENSEPQDSNVEKEYTGQAEAKESDAKVLPIPWSEKEYVVKIKVNVKNGKIVSVEDDSSPVGETNKPYFGLAIANFGKYIGKDVSKIKQSDIDKGEEGISVVSTASVTSRAIHNAVKDALNKAK